VGRLMPRITPFTLIAIAVVLLLCISEGFVTHHFFQRGSLSVLTPLVAIMIIVATGQAFVMATGGIDLSVAPVITLVGSIVLKQSQGHNNRLVSTLLLCLVTCVVIGLINGLLVEVLRLNALVVTLAVGQLVAGYTRIYRGEVLAFTNVPSRLSSVAGADVHGWSYLLLMAVGVGLVATLFLHRFVAGRRLVASSAAPGTALLVGMRASGYRVLAYVIAACAYGVGGVLAAGQIRSPDLTLGDPYLLSSVVAVVLGGAVLTGGRVSPLATLLGAIFVTVLDYDLQVKGYSAGTQMIAQGAVLILSLSLVHGLSFFARLGRQLNRRSGVDAAEGHTATI
jgi:ribose transport system permease protein